MEKTGKIPSGKDLMKTLIDLLADQEGCKIKFELEGDEDEEVQSCKRRQAGHDSEEHQAIGGAGINWPDHRRHVGSTAGICS